MICPIMRVYQPPIVCFQNYNFAIYSYLNIIKVLPSEGLMLCLVATSGMSDTHIIHYMPISCIYQQFQIPRAEMDSIPEQTRLRHSLGVASPLAVDAAGWDDRRWGSSQGCKGNWGEIRTIVFRWGSCPSSFSIVRTTCFYYISREHVGILGSPFGPFIGPVKFPRVSSLAVHWPHLLRDRSLVGEVWAWSHVGKCGNSSFDMLLWLHPINHRGSTLPEIALPWFYYFYLHQIGRSIHMRDYQGLLETAKTL